MKFIVVGVGPGEPDLITLKALKIIEGAGLVFAPLSGGGRQSIAEAVIRAHLPGMKTAPIIFPMTRDAAARDAALREQLEALRPRWEKTAVAALPVIGDSALYATGAWLYEVWKKIEPSVELELVPGVSAHSLAAAQGRRFLAMDREIFTVVPGTAKPEAVTRALQNCDAAALYKPSALKENLRRVVDAAGPWYSVLRADRVGLEGERIVEGEAALDAAEEYLAVLLLKRHSG